MSAPRPSPAVPNPPAEANGDDADRNGGGVGLVEHAKSVPLQRRRRRMDITAEELRLLDALIAGEVSTTQAGRALGSAYEGGHAKVTSLLLRAARLGYYARTDREGPK